jgi:hypothetical protein
MRNMLTLVFSIFIARSLAGSMALADSAYVKAGGGGVTPMKNEDVQLVRETINVTLGRASLIGKKDRFRVEVTYEFLNRSDKKLEILMGFPIEDDVLEGFIQPGGEEDKYGNFIETSPGKAYHKPHSAISGFKVLVDGAKVGTKVKKGKKWHPKTDDMGIQFENYPTPPEEDASPGTSAKDALMKSFDRFYVWKTAFEPGQKRIIVNTYDYDPQATDDYGETWYEFSYVLWTGSLWKDEIEEISIDVAFNDRACIGFDCLEPSGPPDLDGETLDDPMQAMSTSYVFHDAADSYELPEPAGMTWIHGADNTDSMRWKLEHVEPEGEVTFRFHTAREARRLILDEIKELKLAKQSPEILELARSTLLALCGVTFQDEKLQAMFSKKSWYVADSKMTVQALPKAVAKLVEKIDAVLGKKTKSK